jgi:hypothetical protein
VLKGVKNIKAYFNVYVLIQPVDRKTFEQRVLPHEYSVLVYTDGIHYYAKNQDGSIICTDSQTACIQESVNYLASFGGGRVFIKRGIYYPQQTIYIPHGINIIIEGEGPSTVFKYTDSFMLFADSGEPTWNDSVIFRNFTVDRRGSGTNKAEIINISFRGYLEFDGINVYDDYRTGGRDFAIGGYNNVVAIARRNRIFNKSYGIWLFGFFTHIYDNYVENTADVGIVGAGIIYPNGFASWIKIPPGLWVGGHTVIENNVCVDCGQIDEAISVDYMADGQLGDGIGIIRNNLITTKNAIMMHPITVIKVKHAIVEGNEIRGQFKGDLIGSYIFPDPPGSTMYIDILNNIFDVTNRKDLDNSSSVRSMYIRAPLGIKLVGNKFYINYPYRPGGDDIIALYTSTAIVKNNKIVINQSTPGGLGRHISIVLNGKSTDPDTNSNTAIVSENYIYDPNQDIWESSIETIITTESNYPKAYIVFENNLLDIKSYWPALGIATGINLTARLTLRNNIANVNWFRYKVDSGVTLTVYQIDEDRWTKVYSGTPIIYALNKNSGQATIVAEATSVTVNHGLACTPSKVMVTPLGQPSGFIWVNNINNTSFTINTSTPPSTDLPVAWYAEC